MGRIRVLGSVCIALIIAAGCSPDAREPRRADLEAWKGVPVAELETHPHFVVLPVSKRTTSDGRQVWDYRRCSQYVEDTRCVAVGNRTWAAANCSGGASGTKCCHDVFVIRGDTVESLALEGVGTNCYSTCAMRPPSRPCAQHERD